MTENSAGKQRGRPFKKGQSGNPNGKPRGTRHRATEAVMAMLDGEADAITRKAIDLALQGDTVALRLCLERLAPPKKDRAIAIDLPPLQDIKDAIDAIRTIVDSMSAGQISPSEAKTATDILENYRKMMETLELEDRISALEQRHTK